MVPPSLPLLLDSFSDLTTLSFICALFLFSLFSLSFIIFFRFKTRKSHHLKDFNSIWTVRMLLVSFISLWALCELLRLPLLRRHIFPLFPYLTLTKQANLCKIHVVLSQGLFEPGFLVTVLFLVNVSINKRNLAHTSLTAISIVFFFCLPIFFLQLFFVYFASEVFHPEETLPEIFVRSFVILNDSDTVLCAYPLFSTLISGAFGVVYVLFFLLACLRVVSLVINKGLRVRIYALAFAVLLSLPTQVLFLTILAIWNPDDAAFDGLALVGFLAVFLCAVVGEGILVIRPIRDALAVGGESCRWIPDEREKRVRVEQGLGDKTLLQPARRTQQGF